MRLAATALASLWILTGCGETAAQEEAGTTTEMSPDAETQAPDAAPAADDADAQTEALNAWFEEKFEEAVARSPMRQTFLGIRTDYGKWDDPSDEAALEELNIQRANVEEMKSTFDRDALTEQGKLSYDLAIYELEREEMDFNWRDHSYVFNQMFGAQSSIPSFLIGQHKIVSADDAEAYVSRLQGIPDYMQGHIKRATDSAEMGILPPRFVFDYVISDARNVITGYPFAEADEDDPSPLYSDMSKKLEALVEDGEMTADEADALLARAGEALTNSVGPAYESLIDVMEAQKQNATTDDGVWKLPDGAAYYDDRLTLMTTTDMTADEIHELGLSEIERIHGEMRAIMEEVGFEGTLKEFFDFTRTDEQFFKPNTNEGREEYLAEATAMIDTMREALPSAFNRFPNAELEVRAVEPYREKSAGKAFYSRPAPDGSRPGYYYANLYNMADMPVYQMEALAYHEGIPGHHMQLAISQELTGIPKFRKYGGYTAYTEGWGLYSEYLPKEMGFYEDPYSDFGRLAMELWRAARLVVDTGIHDQKWTREEAIQYLLDNTPNPEGDCRKAIERYIVMPGQATAYKIGMNKILELREQARAELGDSFDLGDFHDVVLRDGPVPLSILERNVEDWVEAVKAA